MLLALRAPSIVKVCWLAQLGAGAALSLTLLVLVACGKLAHHTQSLPDPVIPARLVFLSGDLSTPQTPPPLARIRILFPYISGDLYGAPTTGDLLNPQIGADYTFSLDLNKAHEALLASA